jgi:HAD superfamily hydrolase (TIGR01509 family)
MTIRMLCGFIFDVDGTLVDTNALHIEAWRRAFAARNIHFNADRIFIEVGKGGDTLVRDMLGETADKEIGDDLRQRQPEEFEKLAKENGIFVFDGVPELMEALRHRGLKTALATSSNEKQLSVVEKYARCKLSDLVDKVVNAGEIETSKPAPDLVEAAVKKLGMSPAECAMLGDTPYDAESAKHAGVVCLGLTCGGNGVERLMSAGARRVYRDPAEMLAKLDEALHVASPGPAKLTQRTLEHLMRVALQTAEEAIGAGEAPIGAALFAGDAETLIARGFNELNRTGNKTAHAEMVAFARAASKASNDARDLILVSTLEPCVMCTGAAMEAAVDTIVYGLRAPADSGTGRVAPPRSPESQMPRIVPDVLSDESRALFERWLQEGNVNPQQRAYVRQLLDLNARP